MPTESESQPVEQPQQKRIRVKAQARGYYGGKIVEVGEVFEVADLELGGWMQPVDGEDAKRLEQRLAKIRLHRPSKALPGVPQTPVYGRPERQ
jgi:hypothetical protein